ncbi:MAG: ribonuclease HII [Candidatus Woesearchaeota archaeon]
MIIAGVDEAGRGPVLGPMVMCAAAMEESDLVKLQALGVKDSKLLSREQRERIFEALLDMIKYEVRIVEPSVIDEHVTSATSNLNWLEAETTVDMLAKLNPDQAIVDCPSTNIEAYSARINRLLRANTKKTIKLIAEHKADYRHAIVAAASIIAKVTRDREVDKIKAKYGVECGSGYMTDPLTTEFLAKYWNKYPVFRKSWAPWKNMRDNAAQQSLSGYNKL